jgi:large subunit ribosomal protein L15
VSLNRLKNTVRRKARKRLGRGGASGTGGTAGKGHKGQRARAGTPRRPWQEGGQMPLYRRLPKKGFNHNRFKKRYAVVNVRDLARFESGAEVTPEQLTERGLVRKLGDGVAVLGQGEIGVALTVRAHRFSAAARTKIEQAGGTCTVIE